MMSACLCDVAYLIKQRGDIFYFTWRLSFFILYHLMMYYLMTVSQDILLQMVGWQMNSELQSAMTRDASDLIEVPYLHLSGESKKNHGIPQCPSHTGYCQNTKERHYCL